MEALNEDVAHLNSQLLLLASHPERGEAMMRLLGASPSVIQRIRRASSNAVATATRCGVPLVTFARELDEALDPKNLETTKVAARSVPEPLRDLAHETLQIAQRLAFVDRTVAQLHFGFTPRACEGLTKLSVARIARLTQWHGVLIRMRAAEKVQVWDRLLFGDRYDGPSGYRISQQAALLNLGND